MRNTVNLGNPNLLGISRRPTPDNALFARSEGRANPIVTTICFALSAAASVPLGVIRLRPAVKYVDVSSATSGSFKFPLKSFSNHLFLLFTYENLYCLNEQYQSILQAHTQTSTKIFT